MFGNLLLTIYGKARISCRLTRLCWCCWWVLALANALFWNRSLLLALHQPGFPFRVILMIGLAKLVLTFLLVPVYGVLAQAALLSGYLAVSVGIIAWKGLNEVSMRRITSPPAPPLKGEGKI